MHNKSSFLMKKRHIFRKSIRKLNRSIQFRNIEMKLCIIGILTIVCISVFCGFSVNAAGKKQNTDMKKYYTSITVEADDTLWDIADLYYIVGNNERDSNSYISYINDIKRLNNMSTDTLYAGKDLIVYYYER